MSRSMSTTDTLARRSTPTRRTPFRTHPDTRTPTMAYLSLYRKYRSSTFEEVSGQDHVTRTLQNAVRAGRVAHAYLLCGPRGTGKTTTARLLAKALNCERGPTPEPCNKCGACTQINEG